MPVDRGRRWSRRPVAFTSLLFALSMLSVFVGPVQAQQAEELPTSAPRDAAVGQVGSDDDPAPLPPVAMVEPEGSPFVSRVVAQVNAERAKIGAPPLQVNRSLMEVAQDYAVVLGQGTCFAHTCPPVSDLRERVENAGYIGWTGIGENIAGGQQTPEAVMQSWMGSEGHRRNILDPAFQEIGVAFTRTAAAYGIYWVQVFGAKP